MRISFWSDEPHGQFAFDNLSPALYTKTVLLIDKRHCKRGNQKMKQMRKHSKTIAALAVMLSMAAILFLFTACQDSDTPSAPDDGDQTQQPGETTDPDSNPGLEPQEPDVDDVAHPTYVPSREVRTTDDGNLLVIINKEFTVSKDYYPTDMVDIDGSLSTNQNLKVKKEAYDAYLSMLHDAQAEGLNFSICSAYRSYELQESLYNNSLTANGKEYTEKMFAYPGKSEHHTGYAIDITSPSMNWGLSQDFTDYPDGAWITAHCSEYGFIIRYPKGKEDITGYVYEPWHIRYVGIDVAKYITEQGITFEEYLGVA